MNAIPLFDASQEFMRWASLLLLFSIRPAAVLSVLPATDEPMLTPATRNMLAVAFSIYSSAGAAADAAWSIGGPEDLAILAVREAAIGFTVGFAAGKVFWVAQSVGAFIDNLAGYNNVQLTNPSSSEQSTPISNILLQLSVTLFYASGGLLLLFGALIDTYRWWPLFGKTTVWPVWPANFVEGQLDGMMRLVASIATPLLFILALIDLALGLISRSAKNIDTSALGQPLKSAAALLAMVLFSSVFLQDIKSYLALTELAAWLSHWKPNP